MGYIKRIWDTVLGNVSKHYEIREQQAVGNNCIITVEDRDSGEASVLCAVIPDNLDDYSKTLETLEALENTRLRDEASVQKIVQLSKELYITEGAVYSSLNTMGYLTATPIMWYYGNDTAGGEILDVWRRNYMLTGIVEKKNPAVMNLSASSIRGLLWRGVMNMLVSGNMIVSDFWESVSYEGNNYELPTLFVFWDASKCSIIERMGRSYIAYALDMREKREFESGKNEALYDPRVYKYMKDNYEDGKIILQGDNTIYARVTPEGVVSGLGAPYAVAAFSAIAEKRRLQALDHATIAGFINRVLIFKVGKIASDKPYQSLHNVKLRAQAFAQLWQKKKVLTNKMLVWGGDDIDVLDIAPETNILNFEGRFNEADDNITMALNMPRVLLDGRSSGTQNRDEASYMILRARINYWQNTMNNYLYYLYGKIKKQNENIDLKIAPKLTPSQIMKTNDMNEFVIDCYRYGLLGPSSAIEYVGRDIADEIKVRIWEEDEGLKDNFKLPEEVPYT